MGKYLDKTGLTYLWSKIKGAFVKKSGDTMTGTLTLTSGDVDVQRGNILIGGDATYRGVQIKGPSGSPTVYIRNTGARLTLDQYADDSAGGDRYLLPTVDKRPNDVWYAILTTKPQASIYTRLCPGVDLTTTPSAQSNNDVIRFYDVNSKGFGYIGGTQYTNGQTNVTVSAYRTVNGTTVYNALILGVTPEKERIVTFSDVNVWRSALLMLYKAGDTYSESSSVLNGIIRSGGKLIALRVTLPKSLQNISNISVTAFKGWIASSLGIIDSSTDSTNWITKSGVTVRALKKDNYTLLIILETSTVLPNAENGICGSLATFTLSFS